MIVDGCGVRSVGGRILRVAVFEAYYKTPWSRHFQPRCSRVKSSGAPISKSSVRASATLGWKLCDTVRDSSIPTQYPFRAPHSYNHFSWAQKVLGRNSTSRLGCTIWKSIVGSPWGTEHLPHHRSLLDHCLVLVAWTISDSKCM